jgi:hypothetical protein
MISTLIHLRDEEHQLEASRVQCAQSLREGVNIGPHAHRDKQVADEIIRFNRPEM